MDASLCGSACRRRRALHCNDSSPLDTLKRSFRLRRLCARPVCSLTHLSVGHDKTFQLRVQPIASRGHEPFDFHHQRSLAIGARKLGTLQIRAQALLPLKSRL